MLLNDAFAVYSVKTQRIEYLSLFSNEIILNEKQTLHVFFPIWSNPDRTLAQVVNLYKESMMQL